jgi:hypothetical protein
MVPEDDAKHRRFEADLKRRLRVVRWSRAAGTLPVLIAMLVGQQMAAQTITPGTPVMDVGATVQRTLLDAKKTVETNINAFLKENADVGRFISDAFIGYKSYMMLNSIAQRIRYGNISFLVEMALPKIDFTMPETTVNEEGGGLSTYRRTQIQFVPSQQQSQDNLSWLMQYGGAKVAAQLAQTPNSLSTLGTQLETALKSALLNPQGDVTFMTFGVDPTTGVMGMNMRSPDTWVKLGIADATAAWIFSQHRANISPSVHDYSDAVQYVQARDQNSQNVQLLAAYSQLVDLQQQAAANGTSLFGDARYQAALDNYYGLAQSNNQTQTAGAVGTATTIEHLQRIEETGKALQEEVGGYTVMLNAVQERSRALGENLNQLGQLYPGSNPPAGLAIMDFITKSQPTDNKATMGVQLKLLATMQALNQNVAELVKVESAAGMKSAKTDLESTAAKKGALLDAEDNGTVPEKAIAAQAAADAADLAKVGSDLSYFQSAAGIVRIPDPTGTVGADGTPATVGTVVVPPGADTTDALAAARKAYDSKVQMAYTTTLGQFQTDLQTSLSGANGSQGFLTQTLMAFIGAFYQVLGKPFNLKDEASAWTQAGSNLNANMYAGSFDYSGFGITDSLGPLPVSDPLASSVTSLTPLSAPVTANP